MKLCFHTMKNKFIVTAMGLIIVATAITACSSNTAEDIGAMDYDASASAEFDSEGCLSSEDFGKIMYGMQSRYDELFRSEEAASLDIKAGDIINSGVRLNSGSINFDQSYMADAAKKEYDAAIIYEGAVISTEQEILNGSYTPLNRKAYLDGGYSVKRVEDNNRTASTYIFSGLTENIGKFANTPATAFDDLINVPEAVLNDVNVTITNEDNACNIAFGSDPVINGKKYDAASLDEESFSKGFIPYAYER